MAIEMIDKTELLNILYNIDGILIGEIGPETKLKEIAEYVAWAKKEFDGEDYINPLYGEIK
jgi:hypothetical protein